MTEPSFTFKDEVTEDLLCPICKKPFESPVVHACQNAFCSACISKQGACPLCSGALGELRTAPLIIRNMVAKLNVSCSTCGAVLKRSEFDAHAADACPVPCPSGCGARVVRSKVVAHSRECPRAPTVSCSAVDLGCPFRGTSADTAAHEAGCFRAGTRKLVERVSELERQLAAERAARSDAESSLAARVAECERRLLQQAQAQRKPSLSSTAGLFTGEGAVVHEQGLLFWLGTQKGTKPWANPASLGMVSVSALSSFNDLAPVTDRVPGYWRSTNDPNAWVQIDVGPTNRLWPTHYRLSHGRGDTEFALRSWVLEAKPTTGSPEWIVLREHKDDQSLGKQADTSVWSVENPSGSFFQIFRVRITGAESHGTHYLHCSALEFFGVLEHAPAR